MPILKQDAAEFFAGARGALCSGHPISMELSDYERERAANIQRNEQIMADIGLHVAPAPAPAASKKRTRKASASASSPKQRRQPDRPRAATPSIAEQASSSKPSIGVAGAGAVGAVAGAARAPRQLHFSDAAQAAGGSQDFAWRVLQVVTAIPEGKVASYGQCASLAGSPRNARQVGKLLSLGLAAGGSVPWQRVINSAGSISLPPDAGGIRQRQLLVAEGIVFGSSSKVVAGSWWDPDPQDFN